MFPVVSSLHFSRTRFWSVLIVIGFFASELGHTQQAAAPAEQNSQRKAKAVIVARPSQSTAAPITAATPAAPAKVRVSPATGKTSTAEVITPSAAVNGSGQAGNTQKVIQMKAPVAPPLPGKAIVGSTVMDKGAGLRFPSQSLPQGKIGQGCPTCSSAPKAPPLPQPSVVQSAAPVEPPFQSTPEKGSAHGASSESSAIPGSTTDTESSSTSSTPLPQQRKPRLAGPQTPAPMPAALPPQVADLPPENSDVPRQAIRVSPRLPSVSDKVPRDSYGFPSNEDQVRWSATGKILYGASFTFTDSDPYAMYAEESYQFVQPEDRSVWKLFGYCVQKVPSVAGDGMEQVCPFQKVAKPEIRLNYRVPLTSLQHSANSYLFEDLALTSKTVWICMDVNGKIKWRLLNDFIGLESASGDSNRKNMTTVVFPSHTFLTADGSESNRTPTKDVVQFDRQLFMETLDPRTFVITRVNPAIPSFLRWSVQRYLAFGVQSIFIQWLCSGSRA